MEAQRPAHEREINLLDCWDVVRRHLGMIGFLVLASTVCAYVFSYYVVERRYEARAAVLIPKDSRGAGSGGAIAGFGESGLRQLLEGFIGPSGSNREIFLAILKSRTIAQDLVNQLGLKAHYETGSLEQAIRTLQDATEVKVSKEGAISVLVSDRDAQLAADLANAYVTNLDRMFAKLGTSDASRQRAFIADRMQGTQQALRAAEESLRRFQEKNRAVVLPEQAKGAVEAAAKLRAEIVAAEVQYEGMRLYATETNPNVIQQKSKLQELKRQLAQMQYAKIDLPAESGNAGESRPEFHVPFTRVPEVGLELIRLTREVKIHEAVYSLLVAQIEQAKINEARDTPMVQLLDKAVVPERHSSPKEKLNIVIAGLFSVFAGVFLAFFIEYIGRLRRERKVSNVQDDILPSMGSEG